MSPFLKRILISLPVFLLCATPVPARDISFDERVAAQEAIERVYYSHQIGATRPFEEALPRAVLEQKVRTYLKQSAALEELWKTPITASMLQAEVARILRQSRMPDRLREIFSALGNDPVLIQECLARPALAARLVGNFYAHDGRLHGEARHLAESTRDSIGTPEPLILVEERDAFLLREGRPRHPAPDQVTDPERRAQTGRRFPKTPLESWWAGVEGGFDEASVRAVATETLDELAQYLQEPAATSCLPDNTWDNGSLDDLPYGRSWATAVWTGSYMVVWGGSSGYMRDMYANTGGRYDPATDTWLSTSLQNAPSARASDTAVWTGTEMIIWGGNGPEAIFGGLDTGGRYNPLTDTWVPTAMTGAPSPRQNHTAVWTGSRMVVWGGYGWTGSVGAVLNTGGQYDPASDTWTPTSTAGAPPASQGYSAVWTGTEMILWKEGAGGRYVPSSDTWDTVSTVNAPAGGPARWTGDRMLVFSPTATTAGGRYDPGTDSWTTMSRNGAPDLNRSSSTVVWTGSEMILWGGVSSSGSTLNTGGRYSPSGDSWTILSTLNAPPPRRSHVAVWTGSRMVVWGGFSNEDYVDVASGGRYDPLTDSWTPTSETNAPSARYAHAAVWTGNSMIVWGGFDGVSGYLNTGGRYDAVMDDWAPTALNGAPSIRSSYTAVWAGDSMIVWGGAGGGSCLNDGARYNPISDTWTPTSAAGAPTRRYGHTAVWTGNSMIVWGGSDGTVRLNSGAIYDPVADTWSPTSLDGAPSARSSAVAVWTGDRMIVWGGRSGSTHLNSGGRYDPATGAWTPTSTLNTPPLLYQIATAAVWTGNLMLVWGTDYGGGRYDPIADVWTAYSSPPPWTEASGASAVWTGSRMIIWGGGAYPSGDPGWAINIGAIYDPVGNAWVPTSMESAASGRYDHSAVWTGSFMIVWGGWGPADLTPILNNGGRFIYGQSLDDDGDGLSECQGDCNDADPSVYPGAPQICDGKNNDCNDPTWPAVPVNELDADHDGWRICAGDCNDADAQIWHPPVEVTSLALAGSSPTSLSWDSQGPLVGPGTAYDLVSGNVSSGGLSFASGTCLQAGGSPSYSDARADPAPGAGFWYLARASNSCGTGTYGNSQRDAGIPSCP